MGGTTVLHRPFRPRSRALTCLACDLPLEFLPHSYPLVFRCGSGHLFTVRDLFDKDVPGPIAHSGKAWSTVRHWEERSRTLHEMSGVALGNGHPLIAADLLDAAHRVAGWIANLIRLLSRTRDEESSAD